MESQRVGHNWATSRSRSRSRSPPHEMSQDMAHHFFLLSNLKAVSLLFSKTKPRLLAYLCQSLLFIFPTISCIFGLCLFPLRWQGLLLLLLKRDHFLIQLLPKFLNSFHCQPSWKNSFCSWNSFLLFPLSSWTPANRLLPSPSPWTILTKATRDPLTTIPALCSEFVLLQLPKNGWVILNSLSLSSLHTLLFFLIPDYSCPISFIISSNIQSFLSQTLTWQMDASHVFNNHPSAEDSQLQSLQPLAQYWITSPFPLPVGYSQVETLRIVWYVEQNECSIWAVVWPWANCGTWVPVNKNRSTSLKDLLVQIQ